MSAEERDLAWEGVQVDRALDFVNVVFGAWLSAFVGFKLSSVDPDLTKVAWVGLGLTCLVVLMFCLRGLVYKFAGYATGPYWTDLVIIPSGSIGVLLSMDKAGFDWAAIGLIVTFLTIAIAVTTAGFILKRFFNV